MTVSNPKYIAEKLTALESGDEISCNIGGDHYRGVVTAKYDSETLEDGIIAEFELDVLDTGCITVVCEVTDEETAHIELTPDDFTIYAVAELWENNRDVNAFINWEDEVDAPDLSLSELDDDELAELQPEFEVAVTKLQRAMTEVQEMRDAYNGFLEGRLTLADVNRQMDVLELKSGGRLVLDRGI